MERDPYLSVWQLLDELRGSQTVPPGAPGRAGAAVDALRDARAPQAVRAAAEELSTVLVRWFWTQRRDAAPTAEFAATVERLRGEWSALALPETARAA